MAIRMKTFIGKRLARSAVAVAVAVSASTRGGRRGGTVVPQNNTTQTNSGAGRDVMLNIAGCSTGNALFDAQMQILARELARKDLGANSINLSAGNPLLDAQMEILKRELARKELSHLANPFSLDRHNIPALASVSFSSCDQAVDMEIIDPEAGQKLFIKIDAYLGDMTTTSYRNATEADLSHADSMFGADMTAEFGYDDKLAEYERQVDEAADCSYDRRIAELNLLIDDAFPQVKQADVSTADMVAPREYALENVIAANELMLGAKTDNQNTEINVVHAASLSVAEADVSKALEEKTSVDECVADEASSTDFSHANDSAEADITTEFGYEDKLTEFELALAADGFAEDETVTDFSFADDSKEADMSAEFVYDEQIAKPHRVGACRRSLREWRLN